MQPRFPLSFLESAVTPKMEKMFQVAIASFKKYINQKH
jgi:hypothetical protein